jgi:hypothetical protein
MVTYRTETTSQDFIVRTNEDGSESWIPTNGGNSDYAEYLESLEPKAKAPKVVDEAAEQASA